MKALVLTDGKAGHENQSRAFSRALGLSCECVEVHFRSRFHKLLSYALSRCGYYTTALVHFQTALPETAACVVGTGSGTFYAAKAVARRLGVRCGVVLYPRGYRLGDFDCILAPSFDRPKKAHNIIAIPANLVASDAAFYAQGVAAFRARHAPDARPAVAVVIGGPNKCSTLTASGLKPMLDRLFAEHAGCAFWVTTSRRTPSEVEALVARYPWDYKLLYSQDHFNPIPAFVDLARVIYVTAESTGMISEACTFGTAEVRVLDNLNPGPHKFRRFVDGLKHDGYLNGNRKVDLTQPFAAARRLLGL